MRENHPDAPFSETVAICGERQQKSDQRPDMARG